MRFRRTFIFVDLSGFTDYTENFGDGAAAQLLASFRGVARAVGSHQKSNQMPTKLPHTDHM